MLHNMESLVLGNQSYIALECHLKEAYNELNIAPTNLSCSPPFAIFAKKYYNEIKDLNHSNKYDYCFIGSINSCRERREWVIQFAKTHFTKDSIFINTDNNSNWELLGEYDLSKNNNLFFCPKEQQDYLSKHVQYREVHENIPYFEAMCQSKYCLCPAGDSPWSFRFYEVLMCGSIPIVESWHHTYRTIEESKIKYNYVLHDHITRHVFDTNIIDHNTEIFETHHLF